MLATRGASMQLVLKPARAFSSAPSVTGSIGNIMGYMSSPAPQPPLTEPTGEMPMAIDLPAQLPDPVITELPNGVRIATQETFHEAASIGIFVDAGSRHEGAEFAGATHMLEKMAFQSCQEFSRAVSAAALAAAAAASVFISRWKAVYWADLGFAVMSRECRFV